ncbi:hypothetical protein E4U55_001094 [Claviceps digitariae]|nr:hypothetical protein E4U55_001094 [Claviceps digitariae]
MQTASIADKMPRLPDVILLQDPSVFKPSDIYAGPSRFAAPEGCGPLLPAAAPPFLLCSSRVLAHGPSHDPLHGKQINLADDVRKRRPVAESLNPTYGHIHLLI